MKLKSIILPDIMFVALMISKLPPSWFDCARSLKHKSKHFSFDDLLVCFRIDEKHHFPQNFVQNSQSKAYFVENSNKSKNSYKPNPKSFKRHGFNKNKFAKKPSFSKPKNNFSYNNNKNKDKIWGMRCFVLFVGELII